MEAVVETLPRDTLEAVSDASSSLSVSPKSKGGFIIGAPSRKSKGSNPVPLPKNDTSKVQSCLQSDPARAIKKCCKASALRAAALCSSLAANLNKRRACKINRESALDNKIDRGMPGFTCRVYEAS